MTTLNYAAPKTCAAMAKSNAFGRIMRGPVGSGKTTFMIMELLRRSMEQSPGDDGIRHTRWAICRQTLKSLKDTVLRDADAWIGGHGLGEWKVSESVYHVHFGDVVSEWLFLPLEDITDQGRLLSMQLTGAWLSEAIDMNINILAPLSGRIGRYPSGPHGAPTWCGIIADTNMPTIGSQWQFFMENLPPDWQKWTQPSGISKEAENLDWLNQTDQTKKLPIGHPMRLARGRAYYQRYIDQWGPESDWVKRYVYAEYGNDPSGTAVFQNSFRQDFHLVQETTLTPGYPVLIGQDFGRNPWCLVAQMDNRGKLVVHAEIPAINMGLEKHYMENVRPRLAHEQYLGFRFAVIGDPAGAAKDSHSEESSFDVLKRLGFVAVPATTNNIERRIEAVENLLGRQTDGGPTLVINAVGCPFLCRAMAGGYRFKIKKTNLYPQDEKSVPDKENGAMIGGTYVAFSHVVDCLEYLALAAHSGMQQYIGQQVYPKPRPRHSKVSSLGWT